jgi:hypothetical protein
MNTPARTSTTAVISLCCGVGAWVLLPFVLAIVAIVTGHMARAEIRREPAQGDGMAIAGLVLGYLNLAFCIAVIAFVLVLVFMLGGWSWFDH